jgi:hypothetical protein
MRVVLTMQCVERRTVVYALHGSEGECRRRGEHFVCRSNEMTRDGMKPWRVDWRQGEPSHRCDRLASAPKGAVDRLTALQNRCMIITIGGPC